MKKLGFLLIILSLTIIFSACPPLLEDYVGGASGDLITFDDQFDLDVYKWFEILDKIAKDGKFVSLDLSKGTYKEGNEKDGGGGLSKLSFEGVDYIAFDPFPASSSGKDFIISITLPTAAQIIKFVKEEDELIDLNDKDIEEAKKYSAFRAFKNLRSVKADNVTYIGNFAFADCTALNEINFPRVSHTVTDAEIQNTTPHSADIGKYAFLGCTGLKKIKFNTANVIGEYAFKGCSSLAEIDFPEVWKIEKNAFEDCKSLVNVFFEKATKIGNEAFKNCINLEKAEFNAAPDRFTGTGDPFTPFSPTLPDDLPTPPAVPVFDSVIFYPSVFTGCKTLKTLNVRRAWNVYFYEKVFADTSSSIEIYLFDEPDDPGKKSFGHPQNNKFLGEGVNATIKEVTIIFPSNGELIENLVPNTIFKFLRKYYTNVDAIPRKRAL